MCHKLRIALSQFSNTHHRISSTCCPYLFIFYSPSFISVFSSFHSLFPSAVQRNPFLPESSSSFSYAYNGATTLVLHSFLKNVFLSRPLTMGWKSFLRCTVLKYWPWASMLHLCFVKKCSGSVSGLVLFSIICFSCSFVTVHSLFMCVYTQLCEVMSACRWLFL